MTIPLHRTFRLLVLAGLGLSARAALPPITDRDIQSGRYAYAVGWDALIPESHGAKARAPGTFFGDAETVSGFGVGDDTANGIRTVNVRPGLKSALIEYRFDFGRSSSRVTAFQVRDLLRLEPEAGNWASVTVSWQADDRGPWTELRALNGTRFSAPPARTREVALERPAAVIRYRVAFASEKPVAYQWGRARWNYLKKDAAGDTAFRIDFTLAKPGSVPAAAPRPEPVRPTPGSPWGISAHPLRATEWPHLDTLVERVGEARMTWLREDFSFPRILTREGERDFSKFDTLVDRLERAGVGIVGILNAYDNDLRKKGYGDIVPIHRHLDVWREYVRLMVTRYHGRVRHWVVWNEQDGGFWGGAPNAEEYAALLRASHEEIKAIDPGAKVITGGLVYWNANYMRALYRAGGGAYYDIVGMHRYGEGPDGNATTLRTMREFRALMAEHGQADMPVWILESGGSTFRSPLLSRQPLFMEKSIRVSLERIGRPAPAGEPLRAGLVVSPRTGRPDELALTRPWLPGATLRPVGQDDLARLDPADCPVLISDGGLHVDEPLLAPLSAYVERGGLLVAVGHPPFYVLHTRDGQGIWHSRDAVGEIYSFFRMGFMASWNTKGVPEQTHDVFVPAEAAAAGVPPVEDVYVKHFFSTKNQRPGDNFLPLLGARDKRGNHFGDPIALYTYGPGQGGILACATSLAGGWTEEEQARLIPRIYLSYLGTPESKVENIFIYDLHDDGRLPGEREHNFGLVRWDWSPKPAFHAYREMVETLGRAPRFVRRLAGGADSDWALLFRRAEDQGLVLAAWSTRQDGRFTITAPGEDPWTVAGTGVRYRKVPSTETAARLSIQPASE